MDVTTHTLIGSLLDEAVAGTRDDRRQVERYPFFRPVTISDGNRRSPAFSRDISRAGMGLLQGEPVEVERPMTVSLSVKHRPLQLPCETKGCSQVTQEWFLVGVRFCHLEISTSLVLLPEVIREEMGRRMHQRYPLFRPLTMLAGFGEKRAAFCRDVSRGGLGLLHRGPIKPGRVILYISDSEGEKQEISAHIRWCRLAHEDWHLSGATFADVWLEEISAKRI